MAELWKELHIHALEFSGLSDYTYILNFGRRIPRYVTGCSCQEFWNKFIIMNPPNYKNYFEWTVKVHNAVNTKLGKPTMSVEEALKLYTPLAKIPQSSDAQPLNIRTSNPNINTNTPNTNINIRTSNPNINAHIPNSYIQPVNLRISNPNVNTTQPISPTIPTTTFLPNQKNIGILSNMQIK